MQAYYKKSYRVIVNPYGDTEQRWVYGHYNSVVDTWSFKDDSGSTLVNMCFEDLTENILTCMWDIYTNNDVIDITENEYNNLL